ncbi:DUF4124 domain-containing protein [Candidatus Methylocalor cossyra]|uniref:DUF4124 domain-containing protein n=1 Tax=Candidatus Methylocalor cossyra TaxID=3108543 RepID=A0ABM9NFB6_9GAMM
MIGDPRLGAGLLLAALLLGVDAVRADTYRWVDDQGVTHYSDQVPPDQAKQRRFKLSPQARELAVIEAAKSAEELQRERQLQLLRSQQEKLLAEQRAQDLALLRSYRSEDEMRRTLDGKLATLDTLIKVAEANRERQQAALASQERQAADLERAGQPVSSELRELMAATRRQVAELDEKVRHFQAEKTALRERFARDMARYRALSGAQASPSPSRMMVTGDAEHGAGEPISAIACAVGPVCDQAWALAKAYLLQHAAPTLALETARILQTPPPANDQEFEVTVTRIGSGQAEDILFLDLRCRPSPAGEALCASPRARSLRGGFKGFIEAGLAASGRDAPPARQGR